MLPAALLILTLLAATTPEPPAPAKLEFPLAGYRITALDPSTKGLFVFTMYLPGPGKSRSPTSLKVRSEPTTKEKPSLQNIADVKTLRAHNGDTILLERTLSPTEWLMEYTSNMTETGSKADRKTHTYQRVVTANEMAYIISATAPDAQWPELGPKLKACVESFELSSAPASGKVVFPHLGYRINALDGPVSAGAQRQLLDMPGGVHVGIEPYTKTLKDYQAEHKPRVTTFPEGKYKILAEIAPAENTLVTEYGMEIPADKIHPQGSQTLVYEKVVLAHGQLYSATGFHRDWDKAVSSAQIKACVDSLEARPIPAP